MSKLPILRGCEVLPPMHAALSTNEESDSRQDQECQSKTKEKTENPDRQKNAGRFAVLNGFVDFTLAGLTRSEMAVWLVLYRDIKPNGTARTSQADLARRTGSDGSTVRRAIKKLTDKGLLQIVRRGGIGRGASTYRVRSLPPNE